MSKKIAWALGVLCVLLVATLSIGLYQSKGGTFPWHKTDSKTVEQTIDSLVQLRMHDVANPDFFSVEEIFAYRDVVKQQEQLDSAFYALPADIVENVAGVLIKRDGAACKRSIVLEYNANKDIFDNLPNPPVADTQQSQNTSTSQPVADISLVMEGKTTVTEGQPTRVIESVKDTTIDGKATRITTKVEQHE